MHLIYLQWLTEDEMKTWIYGLESRLIASFEQLVRSASSNNGEIPITEDMTVNFLIFF